MAGLCSNIGSATQHKKAFYKREICLAILGVRPHIRKACYEWEICTLRTALEQCETRQGLVRDVC